jgi:hypothetical protein
MRILISNDDGVTAPGLAALYAALADYTECVVIAPEQDKSGASSSLTLDRPLHPQYLANGFISLNGTPTDCVHLGLNGLLEREPDMVVSGINLGANLGDDVLYSGTVAAALEGRFLERPSFAFSLVSRQVDNLPTAASLCAQTGRGPCRARSAAAHGVEREHSQSADRSHSWHSADPTRPPCPGGGADESGRSAWQGRLLDCRGRRCRRWWPGHGLSCGDAGLCVHHAFTARSHLSTMRSDSLERHGWRELR